MNQHHSLSFQKYGKVYFSLPRINIPGTKNGVFRYKIIKIYKNRKLKINQYLIKFQEFFVSETFLAW